MANHRDIQQLTRIHLENISQDMQPCLGIQATQYFYNNQAAQRARSLNHSLHRTKNKACNPKTTRTVQTKCTAKTTRPLDNKQRGTVGPKTWLQNAAPEYGTHVETERQETKPSHHSNSDSKVPDNSGKNTSGALKGTIMAYFSSKPSRDTSCVDKIRLLHHIAADQHSTKRKAGWTDELPTAHTDLDQTQGPQTQHISDTPNSAVETLKESTMQNAAGSTDAHGTQIPASDSCEGKHEGTSNQTTKKRKTPGGSMTLDEEMTVLTWNVMGSTTILTELQEIAVKEKPWVIILTETKFTDMADRQLLTPYLPQYKLYHSCERGKERQHSRSGSGGVTVAVHETLTPQQSVETIDLNDPAAKAHCKGNKLQPPGSEILITWGVYLPCDDMPKRPKLYAMINHRVQTEVEQAVKNSLPSTHNIVAGDMNAALMPEDVQRDAIKKDKAHQEFVDTVNLVSTDIGTRPHRQYTSRHKTDSNQDSRVDDILISKELCMVAKPATRILHSCGDSDHDPMLAKIPLASVNFVKSGPEPPPLPREARLKTPVPQADLDAFKQEFEQETAVETAHLNKMLDDTLDVAYLVGETLEPEQNLKTVLAENHINAGTVEGFASDLSELLTQIMPASKKTLAFTKSGTPTGYRHRSRCTNRRLKGLSKLRTTIHRTLMRYRDTCKGKPSSYTAMRNFVSTQLKALPQQHQDCFPLIQSSHEPQEWQKWAEACSQAHRQAQKTKRTDHKPAQAGRS